MYDWHAERCYHDNFFFIKYRKLPLISQVCKGFWGGPITGGLISRGAYKMHKQSFENNLAKAAQKFLMENLF